MGRSGSTVEAGGGGGVGAKRESMDNGKSDDGYSGGGESLGALGTTRGSQTIRILT